MVPAQVNAIPSKANGPFEADGDEPRVAMDGGSRTLPGEPLPGPERCHCEEGVLTDVAIPHGEPSTLIDCHVAFGQNALTCAPRNDNENGERNDSKHRERSDNQQVNHV